MTERPILFSAPMVRAILAGRKTVTRRVVKVRESLASEAAEDLEIRGWHVFREDAPDGRDGLCATRLPCAAGDTLWVRETWCEAGTRSGYDYAANQPEGGDVRGYGWRPSLFMPRAASRITLEVTGVRVHRLQEITADDCRAEGHPPHPTIAPEHLSQEAHDDAARDWFMDLWDGLNGKRAGGAFAWAANPWVAAISFRRIAATATEAAA